MCARTCALSQPNEIDSEWDRRRRRQREAAPLAEAAAAAELATTTTAAQISLVIQ